MACPERTLPAAGAAPARSAGAPAGDTAGTDRAAAAVRDGAAAPLAADAAGTPARLRADPGDAAHAALYRVLLARDARFDGRLYVGVTSTGVYCRPICRVRTPRGTNCRFFPSAAQAEAAAFRPCLKCRPELAPGDSPPWSVMDASRTLARQAATLLDALAGGEPAATSEAAATAGIAAAAARLGVSERHLRRIFATEHGVTPLQYLQTRRLLLAKQLLTDTALPVAQVALAAGFRSLRRFNAAFAQHYRLSPTRLRAAGAAAPEPVRGATPPGPTVGARAGRPAVGDGDDGRDRDPGVAGPPRPAVTTGRLPALLLGYRPPLDRSRLLAFFAQRAIPGVETVTPDGLRRTLRAGALGGDGAATHPAGWIAIRFDAQRPCVALQAAPALLPHSAVLLAAVRRWLDLDARPDVIDGGLAELPGTPGLRLPGSLDGFELAVRAVLGQQVSVAAARTLAARLVERHGRPLATPWADVTRAFPGPDALTGCAVADLAALGIIRTRAAAILALAAAWPALQPRLRPGADPQPLIDALVALPGIGPWTAHYVAMRALGWTDAFPPGDVAVLEALRRRAAGAAPDNPPPPPAAAGRSAAERRAAREAAERHSAAWRPWRSYAVLRLWDSLQPTP
ncbi:Ada metal-binding domain-containing protein [Piscinibacter sakaiensis]|uniref:DNA-3-methyladenine glycosylase II n=1 Tax=Piscinibacter sakaiensis TaxID=1547922 RepID=A0A0K8P2H9_PISS1|nr:Ada metal-binding domain-containing protein [Piscinibacter sakaiensis]GAP36823.1 ADA regulatory protein [Piscinibacter sakaiensis]